MKHLFIPYELAVIAKEKNYKFNGDITGEYTTGGKLVSPMIDFYDYDCHVGDHGNILAPLYQQIIDWFREKHKLHIKIMRDGGHWLFSVHDLSDEDNSSPESKHNTKTCNFDIGYKAGLNKILTDAFKLI